MSEIVRGTVDCDVHVDPPNIDALKKYLSAYWIDYIESAGARLTTPYPPTLPTSARPEARAAGTFPPRDYAALKAELLDVYRPRAVILNSVSPFLSNPNPFYQAAISTAVNEWMRDEFLEKDSRLRASISVPLLDVQAAAVEIDRVADDKRFSQVLLPIRSETPWGNVRWQPIHDACARHDLTLALHAWGPIGGAPTTTGYARTYLQDSVANSQLIAPVQVLSLVCEGVFNRNPNLRVCLQELGFTWIPALMWRFDKDWRSLWREVPWLTDRPSDYIRRHFRATTAPSRLPPSVTAEEIATMCRFLGASDFLVYASDYPHEHGDDGQDRLLDVLGPEGRAAVQHTNAEKLYHLDPVAMY